MSQVESASSSEEVNPSAPPIEPPSYTDNVSIADTHTGQVQAKGVEVKDGKSDSRDGQDRSLNADILPSVPKKDFASGLNSASLPSSNPQFSSPSTSILPPPQPPSIHKRKLKGGPRGILKPAPPPAKTFSFRRDILQQLNTRLAQQGVNVQVPVPSGSLTGTAQGTAQAASSLLGGMFKKVSGLASAGLGGDDYHAGLSPSSSRSVPSSMSSSSNYDRDSAKPGQFNRNNSLTSVSSDSTSYNAANSSSSSLQSVHAVATNNLPQPSSSIRPLRKVRFIVSDISLIYPISGAISPGEEDATRIRIEEEQRRKVKERKEKRWTVPELEQLYRECCRTREEHPLKKMRGVFQDAIQNVPPALKTIDLSFIPLDRHAIEPVADLLSVDFGLQKLVLENCGLTDDGLKSILHALLVSGTLPNLSLASNKRIKYHGWRYVGIFMRRAKALKYLDLSENSINRASLEHIADALRRVGNGKEKRIEKMGKERMEPANQGEADEDGPLRVQAKLLNEETDATATLTSLRLENCGLKTSSLEMLSQSVRFSVLCHLSLRRNRINQFGAVALALMLKDYPDNQMATAEDATAPDSRVDDLSFLPQSSAGNIARTLSPSLSDDVPVIESSPGGGVLKRTLPPSAIAALQEASSECLLPSSKSYSNEANSPDVPAKGEGAAEEERMRLLHIREEKRLKEEAALALYRAQRAKRILSSMPRMGHLLTLDLKGNDIRGGVVYLGHALKKNRTLKVLNLSDNSIEVPGLVAIADALKYNSTLETLDMSHNPCSGPGLEGITTLRNAFTLNSNLKRLFLSDTELSSEGAIALAEFLPEAKSLIHLDLTENLQIDIAGVMAMAVSVKMNKSLRCLDLNIPPNAPDFARLSQDILNSCIRNTELAQRRAQQKGVKAPIAAPIYKSSLARAAKEKEESKKLQAANQQLERMTSSSGSDVHSSTSFNQNPSNAISEISQESAIRIIDAAQECISVLKELLVREKEQEKERVRDREIVRRPDGSPASRPMSELAKDLVTQSHRLRSKLQNALGVMQEGDNLIRALQVNDDLESISTQLTDFYSGRDSKSDSNELDSVQEGAQNTSHPSVNHLQVPSRKGEEEGLSSPNFSIGSDEEEDEETDNARNKSSSTVRSLIDSSAESALKGLGVIDDTANVEVVQTAAREIPIGKEAEEDVDPETEMANNRAKGQLSEEGEIFRRAKSLNIGEEEEEEEEEEKEEEGGGSDISKKENVEKGSVDCPNGENINNSALPRHSPNTAKSPSSLLKVQLDVLSKNTDLDDNKSESAVSISSEDRKQASGEELRKELLGTDIPKSRRLSSSSASSEALE